MATTVNEIRILPQYAYRYYMFIYLLSELSFVVLAVNSFVFLNIIFCFFVATFELVHDVKAIFNLH